MVYDRLLRGISALRTTAHTRTMAKRRKKAGKKPAAAKGGRGGPSGTLLSRASGSSACERGDAGRTRAPQRGAGATPQAQGGLSMYDADARDSAMDAAHANPTFSTAAGPRTLVLSEA